MEKIKQSKPIGIFDSGIGGLTVLREIEKLMPYENIIYFGDTACVPYGNKSVNIINQLSLKNTVFLLEKKVKCVIIACNTASSIALGRLQKIFRVPIIGVVDSGVEKALEVASRKIGVIGTASTIASMAYQKKLLEKNKKIKVFAKSCPLFVPLVEEGFSVIKKTKGLSGDNLVEEAIKIYLTALKKRKIDTLILGCTHYPLLKDAIANFLPEVFIVDSAKEVAKKCQLELANLKLLNKNKTKGKKSFFISDNSVNFNHLAGLFLGYPVKKPEIVNV